MLYVNHKFFMLVLLFYFFLSPSLCIWLGLDFIVRFEFKSAELFPFLSVSTRSIVWVCLGIGKMMRPLPTTINYIDMNKQANEQTNKNSSSRWESRPRPRFCHHIQRRWRQQTHKNGYIIIVLEFKENLLWHHYRSYFFFTSS